MRALGVVTIEPDPRGPRRQAVVRDRRARPARARARAIAPLRQGRRLAGQSRHRRSTKQSDGTSVARHDRGPGAHARRKAVLTGARRRAADRDGAADSEGSARPLLDHDQPRPLRGRRVGARAISPTAATRQLQFTSYGIADGCARPEFNGGNTSRRRADADGSLWFPSIRGIVRIDPAAIPTNPVPPPVLVEQIVVDGAVVADARRLQACRQARPNGRLQYTALSLVAPERVHFRYRLEGYDRRRGSTRARDAPRTTPACRRASTRSASRPATTTACGTKRARRCAFTLRPHFYQTTVVPFSCAPPRRWRSRRSIYRLRVGRLQPQREPARGADRRAHARAGRSPRRRRSSRRRRSRTSSPT